MDPRTSAPTSAEQKLNVVYIRGAAAEADDAILEQLRAAAPDIEVTSVSSPSEALTEIRQAGRWHALLVAPSLPQNETLALIASLRRDRTPIAIVPVVDETHQDLFAGAVASGADDVLVRRGPSLLNVSETVARIRQSPHLFPVDQRRRIHVLYAGRDTLVWNLLDQVPFVKAEKVTCGIDGSCPVRTPGAIDGRLRADAVVIDENPGDAHPLQVLKSVKAQASDLPVVVLTSTATGDIATAALELGADDTVLKTGIFRRRLIATLRRVHQRLELTTQQAETKAREERLRQIVENVPTGITVIRADGAVLAMNAAALRLFGAARPRDVVGRDFRQLVAASDHAAVTDMIHRVTKGEPASVRFDAQTSEGVRLPLSLHGVVLERDAKGGRGIIASLTRQATEIAQSESEHAGSAELAAVQDSLQRMERHYADLEDVRTKERTGWENERIRLEARLEVAELAAADRVALGARLDEVTDELSRTNQAFATERQSLEERLQQVETAAREAASVGAARPGLEAALDTVRAELREAMEQQTAERSEWQAARQALETRIRDLDAARDGESLQAAALMTLEAEARSLRDALAAERARAESVREQLEGDLRSAHEATRARSNEGDAAREHFDMELARLREVLANERVAWESVRTGLEAAVHDARDAGETMRREWISARETLEAQLREAQAALAAEREVWSAARADLHRELDHARDRARTEATWRRTETAMQQELGEAREQLAREQSAWDATLIQLNSEIERGREAVSAIADEYDATRQRLEAERDEARQALGDERVTWDARRVQLENELHRTTASADEDRAALRARIDALTSDLESARAKAGRLEELAAELDAARVEIRHTDLAHAAERREWSSTREQLEHHVRDAEQRHDHERSAWEIARAEILEGTWDIDRTREQRQQLEATLDALRADYAAMVGTLAVERADRDGERHEIGVLRAAIVDSETRRADLEAVLLNRAAEADALLARTATEYTSRLHRLESELAQADQRLNRLTDEARRAHDALHAEYDRVAESHNRLVACGLLAYAVTTLQGELVRCNDSFARLFGFSDAPDAMTRTAGRLFPGLSRRPGLIARLSREGRIDRHESCIERIDGRAVRILESATLLTDSTDGGSDETLVEHIIIGSSAGPSSEELHARRLQELGALTTAMVPEIETLAATLQERSRDLTKDLDNRRPDQADAEALGTLSSQVTILVRQLAAFSRRQVRGPEMIDLADAVLTAEPMLARLAGDYITFTTDLRQATAVPLQLEDLDQLLTSLVTTARDLLPAGGALTVGTRQDEPGVGDDGAFNGEDEGLGGPVLIVTASGYGVQFPDRSPALELVAQRCGGRLRLGGDPGWMVRFEIGFPRCAKFPTPGWGWLRD